MKNSSALPILTAAFPGRRGPARAWSFPINRRNNQLRLRPSRIPVGFISTGNRRPHFDNRQAHGRVAGRNIVGCRKPGLPPPTTPRGAVLPDAIVDLRAAAGASHVKAQWRYSDTQIHEIDHKSVGSDLKASGPANRTFDFTPDAGRKISMIPNGKSSRLTHWRSAAGMGGSRSTGIASMSPFPTRSLTSIRAGRRWCLKSSWMITPRFGWMGNCRSCSGKTAARVAAGWNAANRGRAHAQRAARTKFQIAVLGINGPISTHPDTYIWVRGRRWIFTNPANGPGAGSETGGGAKDAALDAIIPANAKPRNWPMGLRSRKVRCGLRRTIPPSLPTRTKDFCSSAIRTTTRFIA